MSHEDFINKSLLDSLDAQADAEPISSSSDSEQAVAPSYGSTSNSSSGGGSPSVPYHIPVHHHQSLLHPDSPAFENINQQHIHSQDSLYTQQNMYPSSVVSDNTYHIPPDYAIDHESRKFQQPQSQHQKLDSLNNALRPNINPYFNGRPRHQPNRPGLPPTQYRDTTFYPTSPSDTFPAAITSPVQSHMAPFESRHNFNFGGQTTNVNGGGMKPAFSDTYGLTPMIQSHQLNGNKSQSSQQTQQETYSLPYSNGPQLSSQTPYGPHIHAPAPTSGINGTAPIISSIHQPGLTGAHNTAAANVSAVQTSTEEISTIFVVGFPEDMQVSIIPDWLLCFINRSTGERIPKYVYLFTRF